MEPFEPLESRLKSLALRPPSPEFGQPETLAAAVGCSSHPLTLFERVKNMPWKTKSAALVGVAVSIAVLYIVVAGPWGASLAFADVVDKLRSARTLTYDSVLVSKADGKILGKNRTYLMVPGKTRIEMSDSKGENAFVVFDIPTGKVLMVDLKRKTAHVSPIRGGEGKDMAAEKIERLRKLSEEDSRSLGEKAIDGVAAKGFEITQDNEVTTVWADIATGTPVRIEFLQKNFPTGLVLETWTNIKLDEPLDPVLFSTEPPAGFTTQPFLPMDFNATPTDRVTRFLKFYTDQMDSKFPPRLQDAIRLLGESLKPEDMNELREAAFYGAGMAVVITHGHQGKDWQYYPGRELGEEDKVVFWFHDKKNKRYMAVYGDLRVATIEKNALPPVEDEAAE